MNPLNSLVSKAKHYVMQNILRGDLDKRKSNNVIPQHLMYTEFDSQAIFGVKNDRIKEPYYEFNLQLSTLYF